MQHPSVVCRVDGKEGIHSNWVSFRHKREMERSVNCVPDIR